MGTTQLTIGHPSLIGFEINSVYWIFAADEFKPSYWLILKREGFSGDVLQASDELDDVTWELDEQQLLDIYRLETYEIPWYFFTDGLRTDLETVILSGRIQVFKVDEQTAQRLADRYDPIYSNPTIHDATGHSVVDMRNRLAEELGKDIVTRWIGKDKSDQLHWDRWGLWRETVEVYDVGAEVVDTVVDLVVGLWDIVKFVVTIVGDTIELAIDVAGAAAAFQRKLLTGDIDAIKQDLENMGIAVGNALDSAEALIAKAREGLMVFNRLKDDPSTRQLIIDYFDSLYQTIEYRASRTIGVRIVSEVGIEVLLAMATGGAGNVARRAGQAGAKSSKVAKAASATKRIGPFTTKAVDDMVDLAKALDKPAVKTEKSPITVIPEDLPKKKSKVNRDDKERNRDRDAPPPVNSFEEAEKRLNDARESIQQRKAAGLPLYSPKYSDSELMDMAETGATANDRFLVSVQPKNAAPDSTLSYQRESGLVPTWTTSFDQLEAADKDPKLIHQALGADSNYDPNKEYVMHIIDRGENLDQFGNNTIVPTWDNLADASVRELGDTHNPDIIRKTMNSNYQEKYAGKMKEFWEAGGNEFKPKDIGRFTDSMTDTEGDLFLARHNIRTEIGANSEFTGNGLTANTAEGGGKYGVVETLSLEKNLPSLSQLQDSGVVRTLSLTPL